MNLVCMLGNLTKDPEMNQTASGIEYCRFSVAVDGTKKDQTFFFNCVAWRENATFISTYFKKGSKIAFTGKLTSGTYDSKDGSKRSFVEIMVDKAFFTSSKKSEDTAESVPMRKTLVTQVDDEDLPF